MFSTRDASSLLNRAAVTTAAALALAVGVGCSSRPEQSEDMSATTIEIDRATQLRDWDRSTAFYSPGDVSSEPTRFPIAAPATDIPYGAGVLEPLAFFANAVYFPFSYIFSPPGSDQTFQGVQTEPTYTAAPALSPDGSAFDQSAAGQGLTPGTGDQTGSGLDTGTDTGVDGEMETDETGTPPADGPAPGRTLPETDTTPDEGTTIVPDPGTTVPDGEGTSPDAEDQTLPADDDAVPDAETISPEDGESPSDQVETELEATDDLTEDTDVAPDNDAVDDDSITEPDDVIDDAEDAGIDAEDAGIEDANK